MKKLLIILTILSEGYAYSQNEKYYDLDWKIEKGNAIAYRVAMEPIDTNQLSNIGIDCNFFLKTFSDTSNSSCDSLKDFLKTINNYYKDYSMISTLSRGDKDIIDVKLIAQKTTSKKQQSNTPSEILLNAMTGVILRGKLNVNGGIESFYTKKDQKNLLSLMFELPQEMVKIGDRWELVVDLISMDQNFICEDYTNHNIITLVDVANINGKEIAILKYDIYAYVKGDFNNPFIGESIPTTMETFFNGLSEFNITDGKWQDFNGIMSMSSSGILNSNVKQRFNLIELDKIPNDIKNIK